jgi:DNA transformation protein
MSRRSEYVDFVLEQLASLGEVSARAMFGGRGIYQGDICFAIVVDDRLYFKTDADTSRTYTTRGLGTFTYVARGKAVALQYYEAPPEVFEDTEVMRFWARQAVEVALRARSPKAAGRKRPPSPGGCRG